MKKTVLIFSLFFLASSHTHTMDSAPGFFKLAAAATAAGATTVGVWWWHQRSALQESAAAVSQTKATLRQSLQRLQESAEQSAQSIERSNDSIILAALLHGKEHLFVEHPQLLHKFTEYVRDAHSAYQAITASVELLKASNQHFLQSFKEVRDAQKNPPRSLVRRGLHFFGGRD